LLRLRVCLRPLCAAILLGILAGSARADDFHVAITCVQGDSAPSYQCDRNPIVVTAGKDRILFGFPRDTDYLCFSRWRAQTFLLRLGPAPEVGVQLLSAVTPVGPFCDAGLHRYSLQMGDSHGIIGEFDLGVIEVVPPVDRSPPVDGVAPIIGVFADANATMCLLPALPGRHRAFVCARFDDAMVGEPSAAEFRVTGFPADWPVSVVRGNDVLSDVGNLLEDGVRAAIHRRPSTSSRVAVLYEVEYEVATSVPATLHVEAARLYGSEQPKMTFFRLNTSGAPWTKLWEVCARGGYAYLGGDSGPCTVSVRSESCGHIKSLYGDTADR